MKPKNCLFFSFCIFLHLSVKAQPTAISGIVNQYYQVLEIIPAKACLRVSNPAGLAHNDRVMVIQMKGASINTSTSSSFGDTSSLNNAGNYEIGTVCDIRGDSVFLVYVILNSYTISGKVQIVRIPQYSSAIVTDTLKAAPWNNTTGTGGVLAIEVETDLELNAPIYADSSGFRGGDYRPSGTGCGNFPGANLYAYNAYNSPTQDGAMKGESVTDLANNISGGRGAPANGGGGGNNHNNGGAGGANLSRGGNGGGNSSSTGCYRSFPGEGGRALSSHGGRKIFSGGGGGAGHMNNGSVASRGGGHGGGIIYIHAGTITGNLQKISANGSMGGSAASDGAGGGGAGGTIILDVNNYIGNCTIEANGGTGGTEDDGININRCYGAGGGGSGGVLYFSGAQPAVILNVAAGGAGLEFNRDAGCVAMVPSAAGNAGFMFSNYTPTRSVVLANTYCAILLPVRLISFTATRSNLYVNCSWEIAEVSDNSSYTVERKKENGEWTSIGQVLPVVNSLRFDFVDSRPLPGVNYYRLRISEGTHRHAWSAIQKVYIPNKHQRLQIYPNPATRQITITGGVETVQDLELMDQLGRVLLKRSIPANQSTIYLSLPKFRPGVYVLRIGMQVEKLIIQ